MSADDSLCHSVVSKMIVPTVPAIALARRVNDRQPARFPLSTEPFFERGGQCLRVSYANKTAGGNPRIVRNEGNGFCCREEFCLHASNNSVALM